jgi:adenosylcobinamide kinase / adenosylcobinamide-phosphate guanylyltransferase
MNSIRHLVLGAARSGKTRFALNMAKSLADARASEVIYVATAEAHDAEMRERIARHRAERPVEWPTLEAPRDLAKALASAGLIAPASMSAPEARPARKNAAVIVVDCLTLWLSNALLCDFRENDAGAPLPAWAGERDAFMRYLDNCPHTLILVSNEVGGGIVPTSALARRFQSEQGWLNQDVAAVCEQVTLVVAGLPLPLKPR